jgi:hypothetical protein
VLKRRIVLFAPALAVLAAALGPLLLADRLPDPLATHWTLSGQPDGSGGLGLMTAITVAGVIVAWALLLGQAVARDNALRLTVAPFAWGAVAFQSGLFAVVLAANLDAASWRDVELSIWVVPAMLAFGAAAALVAHRLERERPVAVVPAPSAEGRVGLRPGEQAVWTVSVHGRWATIAAPVVGGALVVGAIVSGAWWLVAVAVVVAAAITGVSQIAATVDRRGLTIAYGPLGWPRQRVPLADVASAEPTDIDPWRVGGWGVRKVPSRAGATAIVIRAGDGIRVRRRDGRELLVTVPDAATGAALLNELSARG